MILPLVQRYSRARFCPVHLLFWARLSVGVGSARHRVAGFFRLFIMDTLRSLALLHEVYTIIW